MPQPSSPAEKLRTEKLRTEMLKAKDLGTENPRAEAP
jgi:hypothetical protein